ncbi:MAG: methyltransferase domain-containing protein [Bacteroidota bacterium]
MSAASFNSTFVGVDSSEEMLNRARKKFLSNPSVTLQYSDLNMGLQFPDESFDCIVSVNMLYALHRPREIITEFYRVLKPHGKLVFANPYDTSTFSGIIKGQFHELGIIKFLLKFIVNLPALLVIIFVNVFFLRNNNNYWSREETARILKEGGFKDVNIKLTYADQALLVSTNKT